MDYNTPPTSWVEHAIIEMRQSPTYREKIVDEWYETLPVPAWDAQRHWMVIGFGKNSRSGGPTGPATSSPPHMACAVSYPDGRQQWSLENTPQRAWPGSANAVVPTLPPPVAGGLMDRRRRYYRALSDALQQGAFGTAPAANPPAACAAARETRAAFMLAVTYPNLAPVYAGALAQMDGWLDTHCDGR
jgi:hypothetical protein